MPPFGDGVQAFSMAPGQACPGPTTTVHGLSLTGNAVHASHCDNVLLSASSAPQPLRGAVQAPSAEGTTAVSTLIGEHVPTGSACGPPESATELSRTIARLRLEVGALTASSSAIFPAALPGLHIIDEALAAAASQDHSTTSPESRSKLQYTLAALSHQLGCVASLFSGASPAVTPPPAASELPEFRGFQDDAVDWVATINALGARKGWSDNQKWCVALDRLQNPAAAWHRYEGVRQQSWADWSAKLIAAFGRIESDLTATSHSTLATTEQGAIEKHNDEAAAPSANLPYLGDQPHEAPRPPTAVPRAPSPDSFPEYPAAIIETSWTVYSSGQISDSASTPDTQLPVTQLRTAYKAQKPVSQPPSWSAPNGLDPLTCCVTTAALSQPAGDQAHVTTASLTHSKEPHHPLPPLPSLAECVDARNLPNAVFPNEPQVPTPPEEDAIEVIPVQFTVAPDGEATGHVDMNARDGLAKTSTSTSSASAKTLEHDLRRKSTRKVYTAMSLISIDIAHRTFPRSEQRRRPRSVWAAVLHTGVPAMSSKQRRGSHRDGPPPMRSLRTSQYHLLGLHSPGDYINLPRGRDLQRPPRHSQGRPPEYRTVPQDSSRRAHDRLPRHSQCRPPEKIALCALAVMAECNDENRNWNSLWHRLAC